MPIWVDEITNWIQNNPQWVDAGAIVHHLTILLKDYEQFTEGLSNLEDYTREIVDEASYRSAIKEIAYFARTIAETEALPSFILEELSSIADSLTAIVSNPTPNSKHIIISDTVSTWDT